MSTILQSVELANKEAGVITFKFGSLEEINKYIETLNFIQYPLHISAPWIDRGTWSKGYRKGVIDFQGWFLTRIRQDANDYRSQEIEEKYISIMRNLCKKYMSVLIESDIRDVEVKTISDQITSDFSLTNSQTFGVSYRLQLPTKEVIC